MRYLSISVWNKPPIGLRRGQQVSVLHETTDGGGNTYDYGEVAADQDVKSATISVRILKDNKEYYIPCEHIKVREVISIPLIVVSDSKLHDTYFVRHFLSNTLLGPDGWLSSQTREPGLSSRIKSIDICSDGAAAHFKQKGSIHFLSSLNDFNYSWVFGCPGHGKGTWDGLGGIVKNKTGKLIKANDLFLSSPYEVYKDIFDLFASEKAQARFHANPKTVIKEWKILWLPDIDIIRPKINGISENQISDLKAFHGVGTRGLFSFRVLHRDGFSVRLSGCHCSYCNRGFCPEGFGTIPKGCMSMEPTQYLICQRSDVDWCTEKQKRIELLTDEFNGKVQQGHLIAVASPRLKQNKTTSDMYSSFDIGKVQNVIEGSYSLLMYKRLPNSSIYVPNTPIKAINILHGQIRYHLKNASNNFEDKIVLDIQTVQNIISNCFNGKN